MDKRSVITGLTNKSTQVRRLRTSWWYYVSDPWYASQSSCAGHPWKWRACHREPADREGERVTIQLWVWEWADGSCPYLSLLRLFAAHVSQALNAGLQLLRLSGDLLDFVGHLLALLLDLVALPAEKVQVLFSVSLYHMHILLNQMGITKHPTIHYHKTSLTVTFNSLSCAECCLLSGDLCNWLAIKGGREGATTTRVLTSC